MTSSLKQVKNFSDPKMINGSATVKNSCGQLFVVSRGNYKERKVHDQFNEADKFYNDQTNDFICF